MILYFVRHGEPDYEHDCLTVNGLRQADGAAARLMNAGITRVYSSPNGRALQTAQPLCDRLGLSARVLPFLHEISWGGEGIPENGHPWTLGCRMLEEENFTPDGDSWREHPYFKNNIATGYTVSVADAFDGLLGEHGYTRQGARYLCRAEKEETVAVFFHGGSGACVLSRLLNLPFPYVCAVLPYDFASVTAVSFPVEPGKPVFPRLTLLNDCAHWKQTGGADRPAFDK